MRTEILNIILTEVKEISDSLPSPISLEQGEATRLFGREGGLDSINLVSLVVGVEQSVEDNLGISISIASERAMSQTRSPFRTIASLTDWVLQLVAEAKLNA